MTKQKKNETAITADQSNVIEHMVAGEIVGEAARLAGCTVIDVETWLESDALFVSRLNSRQQDHYRANIDRLRSLAGEAIDALKELLNSEDEIVRLKAATAVLKAINLEKVEEPKGPKTVQRIERDWARQKILDSW